MRAGTSADCCQQAEQSHSEGGQAGELAWTQTTKMGWEKYCRTGNDYCQASLLLWDPFSDRIYQAAAQTRTLLTGIGKNIA